MDEKLQQTIANALEKLANGAPEFWQQLVAEMQMRGIVNTTIALILALIISSCLTLLLRRPGPLSGAEYPLTAKGSGIVVCCWALVAAFITIMVNCQTIVSPSIALLEKIK